MAFTAGTNVSSAQPSFTGVVSMAGIIDRIGDDTTSQGRILSNVTRSLEIGGVVLSWRIFLEGSQFDPEDNFPIFVGQAVNVIDHRVLICSDRVDSSGAPNSIPDWFLAGTPLVTATTTSPSADANDADYPIRIHHQWHRGHNNESLPQGSISGSQIQTTYVEQLRGSTSLRLRLRLDDTQGLFFHFASRLTDAFAAFPASFSFACNVVGTMYYRFRF